VNSESKNLPFAQPLHFPFTISRLRLFDLAEIQLDGRGAPKMETETRSLFLS